MLGEYQEDVRSSVTPTRSGQLLSPSIDIDSVQHISYGDMLMYHFRGLMVGVANLTPMGYELRQKYENLL